MVKSDLPFGSEFGPNQIDLVTVLELAEANAGDGQALTAAVAQEYNWPLETAKNTRLGLRSYKLIDADDQLTDLARRLLGLKSQPDQLYAEFARHILLNLHGLDVINAINTLKQGGETPTLLTIYQILREQGLSVSESGTHLSKMKGWLQRAGVFEESKDNWAINMQRVEELTGVTQQEMVVISEMAEEQRAVLKALRNLPMPVIPDTEPLAANDVMEYAESIYGVKLNPKNFPRQVLEPLADAGYIRLEKPSKATGEEAGRTQVSGKPYLVYRTEKFANEYLEPLIDALADVGLSGQQLLHRPLSEILAELNDEDTGIKGKALEALAVRLARLLDLEFKAWRKRGHKTSGYEVDAIVESARLIYSRWQIQCKNTPNSSVPLEDIAKEVGIALHQKSNVIMMVTTGTYTKDALEYANDMMQITALNIITLNGDDLRVLAKSPTDIVGILNRKARHVMALKASLDE